MLAQSLLNVGAGHQIYRHLRTELNRFEMKDVRFPQSNVPFYYCLSTKVQKRDTTTRCFQSIYTVKNQTYKDSSLDKVLTR